MNPRDTMRNYAPAVTILILVSGCLSIGAAPATVGPVQSLRCEYLANPLGMDVEKPRLSWQIPAAANTPEQRAYQVLVASSPSILRQNRGDLWDSGRVASAQTTWVEYGGKTLASRQHAWWKVRVWDTTGKISPWSAEAHWSMGLLQASDWHGRYIGERRPEGTAEGAPLPFPWLLIPSRLR